MNVFERAKMTWSVSALIKLPQKWAGQWRHFLGCRKSLFKICICLTELDLKLYFLTKAILQYRDMDDEQNHHLWAFHLKITIGKDLQKWSVLACGGQNVPGRSINFSYSLSLALSLSLISSFVLCTGCNWFWRSQLR